MTTGKRSFEERLWLRLTKDHKQALDRIAAECLGSSSRSQAMRFLIRQWLRQNPDAAD